MSNCTVLRESCKEEWIQAPLSKIMSDSDKTPTQKAENLQDIVALCKRRGFVYPSSDIYGGMANSFDYGPYGVELLRNLKNAWWRSFVHNREDVVGLDSSILLHPKVWEASGHIASFHDPLVDCKNCRKRFRADQYLSESQGIDSSKMSLEEMQAVFVEKGREWACPYCKDRGCFTEVRQCNLMFSTQMYAHSAQEEKVYLRPETAQGIFINFRNIVDSCRVKLPFGVAQIGKSFRNEIVARQFVFRTREFEQLEMEYFCQPGAQKEHFDHWLNFCMEWLYELGISQEKLRIREHGDKELSFYSDHTADIEYHYPFGWGELWGLASRRDYDLRKHAELSKKNLHYFDPESKKSFLPYVVEPALGLNRLFLCVLCDAYAAQPKEGRIYLSLAPALAPVKLAVFPLQKKDALAKTAQNLYQQLRRHFTVQLDMQGSIGKRYYRQDELGTPFCVTVDYQSKEDQSVTLRYRDTGEQERVAMDQLLPLLRRKLALS